MWARLDDGLIDHRKIFEAGARLGKNGAAIALGLYAVGLMWCNKHLSDGQLPIDVVKQFPHVQNPLHVADALTHVGLWEKNGKGYQVHDFGDFNPTAKDVKARRAKDRRRKAEERAGH